MPTVGECSVGPANVAGVSTAISANSMLPAQRIPLRLRTADGLTLVGEAALPLDRPPTATIVCAHPLPTHGGMMDSHVFRKAAWRLPALADIAVVRFNTRGTASAAGTSEGHFDHARGEGLDLAAAVAWARGEMPMPNLGVSPDPWLVGWSFGTDVILKHGLLPGVQGAVLLSPPLRYTSEAELRQWTLDGRPVVALVPEHDDFLPPPQARERFAPLAQIELREANGARHLWVGESSVKWVLDEVVSVVAPSVPLPLPSEWDGPMERWNDLKGAP